MNFFIRWSYGIVLFEVFTLGEIYQSYFIRTQTFINILLQIKIFAINIAGLMINLFCCGSLQFFFRVLTVADFVHNKKKKRLKRVTQLKHSEDIFALFVTLVKTQLCSFLKRRCLLTYVTGGLPYPGWGERKVVYELKVNKYRMDQPDHVSDEM